MLQLPSARKEDRESTVFKFSHYLVPYRDMYFTVLKIHSY